MRTDLLVAVMNDKELRDKLNILKEQYKFAKDNHEFEYVTMLLEEIRIIKSELTQR